VQRSLDIADQVLDVPPAIECATDFLQNLPAGLALWNSFIEFLEQRFELPVYFAPHLDKIPLRLFELWPLRFVPAAKLFEQHVQFEYFFEQLRGNVPRSLLADRKALLREQILGALYRILQRAVAIVQDGGGLKRPILLVKWLSAKPVGMPLPAEFIKLLLQQIRIENKFPR
jgi:hypothetical protein